MMRSRNRLWYIKLTALAAVTALCLPLTAQVKGDGVGNEEVTVVKEYEVTIRDAQKVNLLPDIPEIPETPKTLTYSVPPKDIKDFTFEPNPLKPIALSQEKLVKYNTSYIKVGFGSQLMPLVQLAYNDNKAKNIKYGFMYDHLSAADYKIKTKKFSDDLAGAYFKYYAKKVEVGAAFNFHNLRNHFYGTDSIFKEKQVRQVLRDYNGSLYLATTTKNKAEIDFKQTLDFNYFQETYGKAREWYLAGNSEAGKSFNKYHRVMLNFGFDISNLQNDSLSAKNDSSTLQRNIFRFGGGYGFNNDDWKAHGIFGLYFLGKKPFFYCDVHVEKRLYEHSIIAYADYTHLYNKNSLSTLAHANNFIQNWAEVKNTVNGDFGVGLKGTLQNFSYNIAFHLNHIVNLALFVNDTLDTKRFVVVYDKSTVVYAAHFEAGYNAKEWLRLSVLGDYNHYQLADEARAWHTPAFKTTLRANYVWKNKISLTLDMYAMSAMYAKLTDGQEVKLKGTADINIGVNYMFNKRISFFGMLNNIAHQHYQRYYLYPSYGINGLVGAKFSF